VILVEVVGTAPNTAFKGSVAAAIVVGSVLNLIRRKARCPDCGHDWEIAERPPNEMLKWTHCPECRLDVSREFGTESTTEGMSSA